MQSPEVQQPRGAWHTSEFESRGHYSCTTGSETVVQMRDRKNTRSWHGKHSVPILKTVGSHSRIQLSAVVLGGTQGGQNCCFIIWRHHSRAILSHPEKGHPSRATGQTTGSTCGTLSQTCWNQNHSRLAKSHHSSVLDYLKKRAERSERRVQESLASANIQVSRGQITSDWEEVGRKLSHINKLSFISSAFNKKSWNRDSFSRQRKR